LAPRGIGPTRWAKAGSKEDTLARRRFALIGQTLDGQRVWDVRQAFSAIRGIKEWTGIPIGLQGHGEMAGIVLHASILQQGVARVDLWHPPTSYRNGPTFLNVLRHLDMPQALALALPTPVRVFVKDEADAKAWDWAIQIDHLLGKEALKIRQVGD
jgi:hypothetical protein